MFGSCRTDVHVASTECRDGKHLLQVRPTLCEALGLVKHEADTPAVRCDLPQARNKGGEAVARRPVRVAITSARRVVGELIKHVLEDAATRGEGCCAGQEGAVGCHRAGDSSPALIQARDAIDVRRWDPEMLEDATQHCRFPTTRWPMKEQWQSHFHLREGRVVKGAEHG